MKRRVITLSLLVVAFSLASRLVASVRTPSSMLQDWMSVSDNASPEERWARGLTVPFACVDLVDLEFIPDVSETIGLRLLQARRKILSLAKHRLDFRALTTVHGVGEKKKKQLSRYLTFEKECTQGAPPRGMFSPSPHLTSGSVLSRTVPH